MGAAPQDFRMSSAGGEPVAPLVERGHEVWTLAMRPIATFFGARAFGWEPMSAERAPMKRKRENARLPLYAKSPSWN